ncbi:MAG TPA: hypothetical protein VMK12_20705 [Anaeromyxobacteraceae bacterium]|nr:hypothetical protein [Anaeromyxobacteraceae bacterium]
MRLLVGLAMLAALAAAVAVVPLRGRTILDRIRTAGTAGQFLRNSCQEVKAAMGLGRSRPHASRAQPAHPTRSPGRHARGLPTEGYSERDRAALNRIVAQHANGP